MITVEVIGVEESKVYLQAFLINMSNASAEEVMGNATELKEDIQAQMPVDTGWAQARWGEPEYGGIWRVEDAGLTVVQGSDIEPYEYIFRLNEGYSTQAPAGFIDTAAARQELKFYNKLDAAVDRAKT